MTVDKGDASGFSKDYPRRHGALVSHVASKPRADTRRADRTYFAGDVWSCVDEEK